MATDNYTLDAGPQLLGYFLNWALFGVLNTQVYLYYLYFPGDRRSLKAFVYGIYIYECVQTGLSTAGAFDQQVYHYGEVARLFSLPFVWFAVPIMSAILSAVVQIFFAWRIYRLSRSLILPCAVVVLALFQMGAGTAGGVKMHQLPSAVDLAPDHPALGAWLVGTAVTDVVIAVTMTVLLLRVRTGVAKTDAIISNIVRLTVETGSLTATVAIVEAVLVLRRSFESSLLYECPALVLTKLYANTLLVNLNNREFLRREHRHNAGESIVIPHLETTCDLPSDEDDTHSRNSIVFRIVESSAAHNKQVSLGGDLTDLEIPKSPRGDESC